MTPSPDLSSVKANIGLEYRKMATIRAVQWFKLGDHPAVVMKNAPSRYADEGVPWIETLEGGHVVTPGDWIATGVQGEHWPIKADIFAATYQLATPDTPINPNGPEAVRAYEAEIARIRVRLFGQHSVTGTDHSTACSIWGDNGRGGTFEGFAEPLPCNCGALINWHKVQADTLTARCKALEDVGRKLADALHQYGFPVSDAAEPRLREVGSHQARQLNECAQDFRALLQEPNNG